MIFQVKQSYNYCIYSPVKLAKNAELIPQKLDFGFFFSLYLTNKRLT